MSVLYGTMQNGQLVAVEADAQGRLVATLANPVDPANFVEVAGSTMTGNLTVPSLNTGQLAGFRNVLINGAVTINQRGVTYAAAAVGDYWADRWKKTAGGMRQTIEEGNYTPSTEYTLSGTGVTTQQITSPASGHWTIPDVSSMATNIQLEPGPVATPFERRPIGIELPLCQRYYQVIGRIRGFRSSATNDVSVTLNCILATNIRSITPNITIGSSQGYDSVDVPPVVLGDNSFYMVVTATGASSSVRIDDVTIDAEF